MAEVVNEFTIRIQQQADYRFLVEFDQPASTLETDEMPPLGQAAGPSPSRLLAAAIGNCLAASLVFCSRKARVPLEKLSAAVRVQTTRNEQKRLRIGRIEVTLEPQYSSEDQAAAARCLEIFEDYCTVTQSVRAGIDVDVRVKGFDTAVQSG